MAAAALLVLTAMTQRLLLLSTLLLTWGCEGPLEPATPHAIVAVAAGDNHTCAVDDNGRGYCWGDDRVGQLGADLGVGCRGFQCVRPVPIAGGRAFQKLAVGAGHTCGIASLQVYCWGITRFGQLGDDRTTPELCPDAPGFNCAMVPRRAALGVAVTDVTAYQDHTCSVDIAGRPFCWGRNRGMQLGTGDTQEQPRPFRVLTELRFQAITTGQAHTCGLDADGNAYCWGFGASGRLGTGDSMDRGTPTPVLNSRSPWVTLDAGDGHTCALDEAAAVSCWGLGTQGQLGRGTRISHASAHPVQLPEGAVAVSAGGFHSCAVTESGALYCWGSNANGQLGMAGIRRQLSPARVPLDVGIASVSAGLAHTCAVTVDGSLYCWGANSFGQLGDRSLVDRSGPVRIEF